MAITGSGVVWVRRDGRGESNLSQVILTDSLHTRLDLSHGVTTLRLQFRHET